MTFTTKDSGERVEYPSNMRRDVETNKGWFHIIEKTWLMHFLVNRGTDNDLISIIDELYDWAQPYETQTYHEGRGYSIISKLEKYFGTEYDMCQRVAGLYERGAVKYGINNYKNANSIEEYDRFKRSCFRHFMQWLLDGSDKSEDHLSGTVWNIIAAEYVFKKIQ